MKKGRTNLFFSVLPKFFFVVLLIVGFSAYISAEADSGYEVPMCPFEQQQGRTIIEFDGPKLYGSHQISGPVSASIPTGTYQAILFSYDGYPSRINTTQSNESWYAVLKNDTTTVAMTSSIDDLEDNVATTSKIQTVDTNLVLNQSVNAVSAYHADYPSGGGSVYAICAAFDFIPPPSPPPTCTSNCGGGETPEHLEVFNEKIEYVATSTVLVTWDTNLQATSWTRYDTASNTNANLPFEEYEFVTPVRAFYETEHSMEITGLKHNGTTYYFRPISGRSNEKAGGIELNITLPEMKTPPLPPPAMCNYLLEYIKLGEDNNPVEVLKLETFLNEFEGENLLLNGIYEQVDFEAVERFQEKYREDVLDSWGLEGPTGYVYITTKKKINEIYCQKNFPLTENQKTEIENYRNMLAGLKEEMTITPEELKILEQEVGMIDDLEIGKLGNLVEVEPLTEIEDEEMAKKGFLVAGAIFLKDWMGKFMDILPTVLLIVFVASLLFLLYRSIKTDTR